VHTLRLPISVQPRDNFLELSTADHRAARVNLERKDNVSNKDMRGNIVALILNFNTPF
jgi:hypothetical protein